MMNKWVLLVKMHNTQTNEQSDMPMTIEINDKIGVGYVDISIDSNYLCTLPVREMMIGLQALAQSYPQQPQAQQPGRVIH